MNYADVQGQFSSSLKAIAPISIPVPMLSVSPSIADGISQAFFVAARSIDFAAELLTSDRAKVFYSRYWAIAKEVAKTSWTVALVTIALAMLAIDAFKDRDRVSAVAIAFVKSEFQHVYLVAANTIANLREMGSAIVLAHVVMSATVLKLRMAMMAQMGDR